MQVLLVDDSVLLRRELSEELSTRGCAVLEAGNGVEALELAQHHDIDLFLLDTTMPMMGGLEVLRKLRSGSKYSETPVIMLGNGTSARPRLDAERLGADGWVIKPFRAGQVSEEAVRRLS